MEKIIYSSQEKLDTTVIKKQPMKIRKLTKNRSVQPNQVPSPPRLSVISTKIFQLNVTMLHVKSNFLTTAFGIR